jgi:hypothetical protein
MTIVVSAINVVLNAWRTTVGITNETTLDTLAYKDSELAIVVTNAVAMNQKGWIVAIRRWMTPL